LDFLRGLFLKVIFTKFIMKRVCFIEFEGILDSNGNYKLNTQKARTFLKELTNFCNINKIELILISGFHHKVAEAKFNRSFLKSFFKKDKFFYVDDNYLNSKAEVDKALHVENLKKDKEFTDSYFKQVLIQQFLFDNKIKPEEVLLLCNDVWVDGYYTTRFSKVDFAVFEDNLLDRRNLIDRISGLAYFNLNFSSVKILLENFPNVDFGPLNKFVFKKIQEALLKDVDFSSVVKKVSEKQKGDETIVNDKGGDL